MSGAVDKIKSLLRGQVDPRAKFAQDAQAVRNDVSDLQRKLAATALPAATLKSPAPEEGGRKIKALILTAALAVVCLGGILFAQTNTVAPLVRGADVRPDLTKGPHPGNHLAEATSEPGDDGKAGILTSPQCSPTNGASRKSMQNPDKCQNLPRDLDAGWPPLWEQPGEWHQAPGFGDARSRDLPSFEGQWHMSH